MTKLAQIADRVLNRPLMILPEKLGLIASVLDGRIGIDATGIERPEELEAALSRQPEASRYVGQFEAADPNDPKSGRKPYRTTSDGVAIIPVLGSLVNRGGWLDAMSGITSYEKLKFQIASAARDGDVTSIILDIDSPGGEAVGAFEVGDVVREASQSKDVIAVVNGMAASAAYAIAAQATHIVTTSSGISGSIGVVMLHADYSVAIANRGIKPTLIHAGARKVDGNPYTPLTDDVKAELKAEIDRFYDLFVASVAQGRVGMTEERIRATEARTYIGADAVAVGLADAIGSFENVLSQLSGRTATPPRNNRKGMTMSKDTPATFTQAQLDAAVAQATTEAAAGHAAALSAARTEAATAERSRISAILSLPEAVGREAHAFKFALNGKLSADEAKELLTGMTPGVTGRASDSEIGLSVEQPKGGKDGADASSLWDKSLASRGMKVG